MTQYTFPNAICWGFVLVALCFFALCAGVFSLEAVPLNPNGNVDDKKELEKKTVFFLASGRSVGLYEKLTEESRKASSWTPAQLIAQKEKVECELDQMRDVIEAAAGQIKETRKTLALKNLLEFSEDWQEIRSVHSGIEERVKCSKSAESLYELGVLEGRVQDSMKKLVAYHVSPQTSEAIRSVEETIEKAREQMNDLQNEKDALQRQWSALFPSQTMPSSRIFETNWAKDLLEKSVSSKVEGLDKGGDKEIGEAPLRKPSLKRRVSQRFSLRRSKAFT